MLENGEEQIHTASENDNCSWFWFWLNTCCLQRDVDRDEFLFTPTRAQSCPWFREGSPKVNSAQAKTRDEEEEKKIKEFIESKGGFRKVDEVLGWHLAHKRAIRA